MLRPILLTDINQGVFIPFPEIFAGHAGVVAVPGFAAFQGDALQVLTFLEGEDVDCWRAVHELENAVIHCNTALP